MKNQITIIRIDPDKRTFARIPFRCGKNAVPEVKRVLRAKTVGHYELCPIGKIALKPGDPVSIPLMVAAGLDVEKDQRGWRLKGGSDTAGIGMLFGKGEGGGMVDCPVDVAWVEKMIVWLNAEDVEGAGDE